MAVRPATGPVLDMIRSVGRLRIESVADPLNEPALFERGVEALKLGEVMGLLEQGEEVRRLDLGVIRRVAAAAARAGVGAEAAAGIARRSPDRAALRRSLEALVAALEGSPIPAHEWAYLVGLLDAEQLASMVGVSASSLRRYGAGTRPTPDNVAARLHFLAKVVADLLGAYNDVGVRRWFERKRTQLDGRSPRQLLSGRWDPDDERPVRVRELARSLAGGGAT